MTSEDGRVSGRPEWWLSEPSSPEPAKAVKRRVETHGHVSGRPDDRQAPPGRQSDSWTGDVGLGVRAWVGETPTPPDPVQEGPDADQEAVARKILLDQLTGQARSRSELAAKLAAKNVPADIASRLLDRFEEVGLVDDAAFARAWVSSRGPGKGLARRALAEELRRKGVPDDVAREALDEIDPADEEATARSLVRKKLRSMHGLDGDKATRRLVGLLARKGYPPGLAFSVVKDELASAGRPGPS
jgi:regulatory protein